MAIQYEPAILNLVLMICIIYYNFGGFTPLSSLTTHNINACWYINRISATSCYFETCCSTLP